MKEEVIVESVYTDIEIEKIIEEKLKDYDVKSATPVANINIAIDPGLCNEPCC